MRREEGIRVVKMWRVGHQPSVWWQRAEDGGGQCCSGRPWATHFVVVGLRR